jgi:hypothetical protein
VCDPGSLQWGFGAPGVQPDQVDGGGGEGVFEVDFGEAGVAGVADAGDRDGLAYGALDSGPGTVGLLPRVGALLGAGLLEGLSPTKPKVTESMAVCQWPGQPRVISWLVAR